MITTSANWSNPWLDLAGRRSEWLRPFDQQRKLWFCTLSSEGSTCCQFLFFLIANALLGSIPASFLRTSIWRYRENILRQLPSWGDASARTTEQGHKGLKANTTSLDLESQWTKVFVISFPTFQGQPCRKTRNANYLGIYSLINTSTS